MKSIWKSTAGALRLPLIVGGTSAVGAGRLDWPPLWLWIGLMGFTMAVNLMLIARWNPELLAERFRQRGGTAAFDRVFAGFAGLLLTALAAVAGLDGGRFGWSEPPEWTRWVGVALHLAGNVPVVWALCVNRHLETTVRLQRDRGHKVVTTGPYAIVRHPMYTGMLTMLAGWPLILGSLWALIPYGLFAMLLVWRTGREDRTLRTALEGYEDYAGRTKYRLAPGLW